LSISLPQRMSVAPPWPDVSSVDGSTLRPLEKPAAAEYITLATSSNVTATAAKAIATRLEILVLLGTFPGGGESVGLEFGLRNIGGGAALRRPRRILRLFIGGEQ